MVVVSILCSNTHSGSCIFRGRRSSIRNSSSRHNQQRQSTSHKTTLVSLLLLLLKVLLTTRRTNIPVDHHHPFHFVRAYSVHRITTRKYIPSWNHQYHRSCNPLSMLSHCSCRSQTKMVSTMSSCRKMPIVCKQLHISRHYRLLLESLRSAGSSSSCISSHSHHQRRFVSSSSLYYYMNHQNNNSNNHFMWSSQPQLYPRRSLTTTTDNRGGISNTGNKPKKSTSWRKAIHVSDETPTPVSTKGTTSSTMNNTTTTTTTTNKSLQFMDTPLGKNGMHLLDGLDHYTVYATDDQHPLSVYGIQSEMIGNTNDYNNAAVATTSTTSTTPPRKPILLLHGRTWSSVPVYHLLGGPFQQSLVVPSSESSSSSSSSSVDITKHESRSLMEALLQKGLQPYCMDFRGFGGTHMDQTQAVEPYRCVQDAESVLQWIYEKHSSTIPANSTAEAGTTGTTTITNGDNQHPTSAIDETAIPALLGWSQGALVAQLVAQRNHLHYQSTTKQPIISKLILYGSIYDPLVRYPREPLYVSNPSNKTTFQQNTYDAAIEDFTVEGTIPPEPARLFAEAALLSDPIKVVWKNLYQFNNCDPARVHVPCLVIAGDQDPYAPLHVQQELFCNLARASDRTWSILSGSDHACHLLDGRDRLINTVVSFVLNGKRTEPRF